MSQENETAERKPKEEVKIISLIVKDQSGTEVGPCMERAAFCREQCHVMHSD